ncbi:MFS transporter [Gulosibacter sediminis]|uniref:MFS transporter n=1 Tax=Gulosibacter sediminis TaxID=1729695 RepID=UPI0024A9B299|nr:MFS transporter [Gulosibacter sediminis]
MATETNGTQPPLWRILIIALLPTFIYSVGQGAIVPVIPAVATSLGADLGFAGFIAGSLLIGQAVGNLPAGAVVSRFGERRAMVFSAFATIVGALISVFAVNAWMLLAGVLVQGLMTATFALARQAFLSTYVPFQYRARSMSTLGGVFRSGMFVGPFIATWMITATGDAQTNFWVFIVCSALAAIAVAVLPDVEKVSRAPRDSAEVYDAGGDAPTGAIPVAKDVVAGSGSSRGRESIAQTFRRRGDVLLRLGTGAGILMMMRSSRQVLLPLWGLSIGLDDAFTTLIIGIAGAIDFALFFTSGWIMDRFGRSASGVPALLGMGLGFAVLAFTHDLDASATWFVAITLWLGVANGVGSGIVMTLAADLADREHPAPFLAAWRTVTDGASSTVPFVVSGLHAFAGIAVTSGFFGVLGLFGAWLLWRYIPKYIPKPRRR